MSQESDHAVKARELLAGEFVPEEERLLQTIRDLFGAVVEHRLSFHAVVRQVRDQLVPLKRSRLTLEALERFDARALREKVEEESARAAADGGLKFTRAEEEFSRDVIGIIDFATRNGLSLSVITSLIVHDLREILDFEDMDEAVRGNVLLQCHEYRELSEAPIGNTEPD